VRHGQRRSCSDDVILLQPEEAVLGNAAFYRQAFD
jgi:hypothetical protein